MEMDTRIPIRVIVLSEPLEDFFRNSLVKDDRGTRIEISPEKLQQLIEHISLIEDWCLSHGFKNVPIVCRPDIRLYFRRLIERKFPELQVISYLEITPDYKLDIINTIDF